MQLPFTREQFFDVFAAYNATLWPAVLALWIASVLVAVLLFARPHRVSDRVVSTLLAIHWAWSALAYHLALFTSINPAAWFFAALFLVEAGLFVWWGAIGGTLRYGVGSSAWAPVAWVLIAYSLVYPLMNAAQHGTFVRIPAFGVPCPTTIFTIGLLMLATPRVWALVIVPIVWSAIGGSAASLLAVRADYALPVAGVALMLSRMFPKGHAPLVRKQVTETRVLSTDAAARQKFGRYWPLFSPGIKLIRRIELREVKSQAAHRARGGVSSAGVRGPSGSPERGSHAG